MRPITRKLLNGVRFCKSCGARMLFQGYDLRQRLSRIMSEKEICYECAYWIEIIEYPQNNLEVVDNKLLRILPIVPRRDKSMLLGNNGKMRYFMRPDHTLFKSNDVWLIGTIPERFREKFQETAFELTSNAYRLLSKDPNRCIARGCFDRYQCLRYKLEIEALNGPYNIIPKNWKTGDEHCKYFIDAKNIITDESRVDKK